MLDRFLCDHDGVITLAQAQQAGLNRQAVYRRVCSGHWLRCSPGVYFVDDRPFTDRARIRAAVWGCGPRATASGITAAWWQDITKYPPDTVEVTVPKVCDPPKRYGIRTRRRDLDPADCATRHGLRVTTLALTVVEAAARRGGGMRIIDAALQRHLLELRDLWGAHLRNKGRHGSPAARRLLRAADSGAHSEAERLLVGLLRQARITGWKANQRLGRWEIDVLFRGPKIAIEVDGLAFHTDTEAFQRDRVKQNELALMGYQVLRFTWLDLTEYPERVIAEIEFAISRRADAAASSRTGAAH
ncbi:MAG: type IV toxin-antitoxin system AbiEi family antitoxin domain-containing protein [Mycobacterium sp.]|nr:type IV toxin-antitoxin system AbiEi family antitoxin domain-containing protein [Mycobacterium sp.]